MSRLLDDISEIFFKVMIPAFITIVAKISVQNNRERVSITNIFASVASGLGLAYLSGSYILNSFSEEVVPLMAGAVALLSEHVISIVLYKLSWDKIGDAILVAIKRWIGSFGSFLFNVVKNWVDGKLNGK